MRSLARHGGERLILPVLRRGEDAAEKAAHFFHLVNGHADPFARGLRDRDALAATCDGFRQFIEAKRESGTRRKQGIEKMDGKVAADAAIGEPDFRLHDGPRFATETLHDIQRAAIVGIGRNGLEQHREAQAHACRDDDRQLGGFWKSLEFGKGAARCCDLLQPVHHGRGKEPGSIPPGRKPP